MQVAEFTAHTHPVLAHSHEHVHITHHSCGGPSGHVEHLAAIHTLEAGTGGEALGVLEGRLPDAVVLDLGLPGGEGRAVLARLHGLRAEGAGAPVWLVMSALSHAEAVGEYGVLGGPFLAKPFDPWRLARMLQGVLGMGGQAGPRAM